MNVLFDCTERIEYDGNIIRVHWKRCELTKKSDIRIFENDNGMITIEKDYIIFEYNGIRILDSYESDKHVLGSRVHELCGIVDTYGTDGLTKISVKWQTI